MKFKILLSIVLSFIVVAPLFAQFDARTLPFFLDVTRQDALPQFRTPTAWMRAPKYPPEVYKKTNYLQGGSVTSPDGFRISLASVNSTDPNVSAPADQTETWVAVNPNNPDNIIAGSNDSQYNGNPYRMTAFVTFDGGKTWRRTLLPENSSYGKSAGGGSTNFDPGICFDTKGNAYYCYGWARLTAGSGYGDNFVLVSKSTDGGLTWKNTDPVYSYEDVTDPPFNDKYLMTCDVNPTSPYKDNIYITWTHFGSNTSPGTYIAFSRSTNGGQTWSDPPLPLQSGGGIQSPVPAVGPDGTVYVAWRSGSGGSTQARVKVSKDGGKTFGASVLAQTVGNIGTYNSTNNRYELADKQRMRISSFPGIDVDRSSGSRRGWVYLVQAGRDLSSTTPGIYLKRSSNQGVAWSASIRVDGNTLNNDCYLPSVTVDAATGRVGVFYYSSQNVADNKGADAYFATSSDGGATWKRFRLSPKSWRYDSPSSISPQGASGGNYWGDYTASAAWNGKFYPCFWMPDASNNMSSCDTYVGIVSFGPRPVTQAVGQNDYLNPKTVKLTWVNPSQNLLGEALTDYKILVFGGANKIAELVKGTTEYTDNNAVDGSPYSYSLIIETPDGQQSESVIISGIAGGSPEPMAATNLVAKPDANGITLSFINPGTHIDNSLFNDFHMIYVYGTNDALVDSIPASQMQIASAFSKVIPLTKEKFYTLKIKAAGIRNGKITQSVFSNSAFSYSGAPLIALNAAFDGAADSVAYMTYSLTAAGAPNASGTVWGKTNVKSVSAPNCITDSPAGRYSTSSQSIITLAPIVVQADSQTLSFSHICLVRTVGTNSATIEVSKDFGATWEWLKNASYNRNTEPSWNGTADINAAQWAQSHRTLADFTGDTIYVRFVLRSAIINADDGWYIDNIVMGSNPVSVETERIRNYTITIEAEPNPAHDEMTLRFSSPLDGDIHVQMFDILGRTMSESVVSSANHGLQSMPINLSSLAQGVYFCRVRANSYIGTVTVSVLR